MRRRLEAAAVVGTGRADFSNMINNIAAFPGILKGALAVRASDINESMLLAAAIALANLCQRLRIATYLCIPRPAKSKNFLHSR